MDLTISSKYQVVIPKAVRRQLNLKPGQKLHVEKVAERQLTLSVPLTAADYLEHYYGSVPQGTWGKDPAKTIRKLRDEWQ